MEHQLKCPSIESSKFLCDREAFYQIDGIVYCQIHARRIMKEKLNWNLDAPMAPRSERTCMDSEFYHVNQGLEA